LNNLDTAFSEAITALSRLPAPDWSAPEATRLVEIAWDTAPDDVYAQWIERAIQLGYISA